MVAAVVGLLMGTEPAGAKPACNTTTSSKCTSGGESCTVTKEVCTTFNPDGTTKIATTTSHDCGTGGPKACGGKTPTRASSAGTVSTTTVDVKDAGTGPRKPRVPRGPLGDVKEQAKDATPTPTPKKRLPPTRVPQSDVREQATPTPTPQKSKRGGKANVSDIPIVKPQDKSSP